MCTMCIVYTLYIFPSCASLGTFQSEHNKIVRLCGFSCTAFCMYCTYSSISARTSTTVQNRIVYTCEARKANTSSTACAYFTRKIDPLIRDVHILLLLSLHILWDAQPVTGVHTSKPSLHHQHNAQWISLIEINSFLTEKQTLKTECDFQMKLPRSIVSVVKDEVRAF